MKPGLLWSGLGALLGLVVVVILLQRLGAPRNIGLAAPNISSDSVWRGTTVKFDLREQLSRRAVVLYFFPKAFTAG